MDNGLWPIQSHAPKPTSKKSSKAAFRNRAFLPDKEVSEELWKEILETATRAPSWKNAQSYKISIVSGEKKKALAAELRAAGDSETDPYPQFEYESGHPSVIKKRMFTLGMALYDHIGIDRKDKPARKEFALRNFDGFDVPHMLFFYIPAALREWTILDLGILMGYLSLVIGQYGLGSCMQASLASYPDIVAKYTGLGDDYKLMVGMSVGYPDRADKTNSFIRTEFP